MSAQPLKLLGQFVPSPLLWAHKGGGPGWRGEKLGLTGPIRDSRSSLFCWRHGQKNRRGPGVVSAADAAVSYSPACERRVCRGRAFGGFQPRMRRHRIARRVNAGSVGADDLGCFQPRMGRHRIARRVNAGSVRGRASAVFSRGCGGIDSPACERRVCAVAPWVFFSRGCGGIV